MHRQVKLTPAKRAALESRLTARLGWDQSLPDLPSSPGAKAVLEDLLRLGTVERIRASLRSGDHQTEMRLLYAIFGSMACLMESIILQPEFAPLFTREDLVLARRRLTLFIRNLNGVRRVRRGRTSRVSMGPSRN